MRIVFDNSEYEEGKTILLSDLLHSTPLSSLIELNLGNTLDRVKNREQLLDTILFRLRYGGVIEIYGIDFLEVVDKAYHGKMTPSEAIEKLYNNVHSVGCLEDLVSFLEKRKFCVLNKSIQDSTYYIKAERSYPDANTV